MTFATMSYLLRHNKKEEIFQIIKNLTDALDVIPVNTDAFNVAIGYGPVEDFEDLLQYQSAVTAGCDIIITNNKRDFAEFCQLPLMTAEEYLLQFDV